MPPKRVLVSGATGFLGSTIVASLREQWPEVELAAVYVGLPKPAEGIEAIEADICNLTDDDIHRIAKFDPDTLYHVAGVVRAAPDILYGVNVGGTARLLSAVARARSMNRVVLAASTSIYGPVPGAELPVREDQPLEPANDYAISKLAQELLVQNWCQRNAWSSVICRISNPIGPGQGDGFFVGKLVRQFAAIAAGEHESRIELWHLAGSRDFIDSRDVGDTLARLATMSTDAVVNVGHGKETELIAVFETLKSLVGMEVELVETRIADSSQILRQQVDVSRLREFIGEPPSRPLRATLADMLEALGWRPTG